MPAILKLLLLLAPLAASAAPKCRMDGKSYPPDLKPLQTGEAKRVDWTVVDLDTPAAERWTHVVAPQAAKIETMVLVVVDTLVHLLGNGTVQKLLAQLDDNLPLYLKRLPEDFGDEILGIATVTGIRQAYIFIYNIFYTVFGACTSIVAERSDGQIFHARNLDFGLWPAFNMSHGNVWSLTEHLRPLIVNIDMQRGGKTVFKSTTYAGFIGAHTAMRPDAFAITIDTRFDAHLDTGLLGWLLQPQSSNSQEVTMMARQVMQEATSYPAAFKLVAGTKVVGPAYLIMSGVRSGEGAVVTKGAKGAFKPDGETVDVWKLADEEVKNSTYFLVQTNYDRTGKAPGFDNRRDPAKLCMHQLGRAAFNFSGLYNVLVAKPNLNRLTTYTTLMHTQSGDFEAYRQLCQGLDCSWW